MKIKLFEPESEMLKKYIDFFYFINRNEVENDESYMVFPNIKTCVSIFEKTELIVDDFLIIKENKRIDFVSVIDNNNSKPELVTYSGAINEVCIGFKPLGINHFLIKDLDYYLESRIANNFNPYDDYKSEMLNVFSKNTIVEKQITLEKYLLSKFKKFEHPFLNAVVFDMLMENNGNLNINQIAKNNNITVKTLIKHFNRHIGKSPNCFKKIIRFRNLINNSNSKNGNVRLTDLILAENYFDQSHMIKDFKSLTGETTKVFFTKLSTLFNGKINIFIQ